MSAKVVRRIAPLSGALLILLAACDSGPKDVVGDGKLDPLKGGTPIAEVTTLLGEGPLKPRQPSDTLRLYHGYRTQAFLAQGERYTVLWYREKAGDVEEPITRELETPILMHADTVVGHGWSFYDKKSGELGIPNPLRGRERLDSISKSQQPKAD